MLGKERNNFIARRRGKYALEQVLRRPLGLFIQQVLEPLPTVNRQCRHEQKGQITVRYASESEAFSLSVGQHPEALCICLSPLIAMRPDSSSHPIDVQDKPLTILEAVKYTVWLSGIVGLMAFCLWAVPQYFEIF
jgi:hypothetical protein